MAILDITHIIRILIVRLTFTDTVRATIIRPISMGHIAIETAFIILDIIVTDTIRLHLIITGIAFLVIDSIVVLSDRSIAIVNSVTLPGHHATAIVCFDSALNFVGDSVFEHINSAIVRAFVGRIAIAVPFVVANRKAGQLFF